MGELRPEGRWSWPSLTTVLSGLLVAEVVCLLLLWWLAWAILRGAVTSSLWVAFASACIFGLLCVFVRHFSRHHFQFSLRTLLLFVLLVSVLTSYVGPYWRLSRQGFAWADEMDAEGFYFFPPEDTDEWRFKNYTLARIYYPLIVIDNWLGTGRPIGSDNTGHRLQ